ncbi:hypothetical protein MMC14_002599 [Varicellaria rhodocarpa]|nr:hypothetical protein [Varicellaria rhodocarpa]
MTSVNAGSTVRSVIGRAVHIKIYPKPRHINESREVLRVLERYGEVVMYRYLKYEPNAPADNSALAIYRENAAAEKALRASPMSFFYGSLDREVKEYGLNAEGVDQPSQPADLAEEQGGYVVEETNGYESTSTSTEADDQAIQGSATNDAPWGRTTFSSIEPSTPTLPPSSPSETTITASTSTSPPSQPPPLQEENNLPAPNTPTSLFPHSSSSSSSSSAPQPHQAVRLHISLSHTNHQAYISRQGYYEGFKPSTRTMQAADLETRVPLAGLVDVRMEKGEVPLRIRKKMAAERNRGALPPLKELWERGMRVRGERWRWRGGDGDVDVDADVSLGGDGDGRGGEMMGQ